MSGARQQARRTLAVRVPQRHCEFDTSQVFSFARLFFVAFWKESCYAAPNQKHTVEITSFTPPPIELLNQLLPAYDFVDFIAQGGMGAVYLAKQVSLDREVAVKILPMELTADPEFSASFKTEARAMAKLNHPNLIAIYDFGEINGMLFIAMEYVPGKSLYHLRRLEPCP